MRYSQIQTSMCQTMLKFLSRRYIYKKFGGGKVNYIKNVPVNKVQDDSSVFIVEKEKGATTKKKESTLC